MAILTLETKQYAIKIDKFEGPLDLLCHLIDVNKMDIYDININDITDQYVKYLNRCNIWAWVNAKYLQRPIKKNKRKNKRKC